MTYHIYKSAKLFLFWLLMALALANIGLRWLLADCDKHTQALADVLQNALHTPVHIGSLQGRMHRLMPMLVLSNVSIGDAREPAITVKQAYMGVHLWRLLTSGDVMASAWTRFVGGRIALQRAADGKLGLKGMPAGGDSPGWLLHGSQYAWVQTELVFEDLSSAKSSLTLPQLDMVLNNTDSRHDLHVQTTLPAEYGESVRVSALLEGDFLQDAGITGQIYASGVNLQLASLFKDYLPAAYQLKQGMADLQVWSDWQSGQLERISGSVNAKQFALIKDTQAPLQVNELQTYFSWLKQAEGWRLGVYDLNMVADTGEWRNGEFYLGQLPGQDWSVWLKQLDLAMAMPFARLLVDNDTADLLVNTRVNGKLYDVKAVVANNGQSYAINGGFADLSNLAYRDVPGLQHISGQVQANQHAGLLSIQANDIQVDALSVFRTVIGINALQGVVSWQRQDQQWLISGTDFVLDTADFKTRSDFSLSLAKDAEPNLDLHCHLTDFADISHSPLYLPTKVMDHFAVEWLDHAFARGVIKHGDISISGNPNEIMFTQSSGKFEILLSVEDVDLMFNPYWPKLQHINADVHFLGPDLLIYAYSGDSEGVELKQAVIKIPDLVFSNRVLINGQLETELPTALQYLEKSPLQKQVAPVNNALTPSGHTTIGLNLEVPFDILKPMHLLVTSSLDNASLVVKQPNLPITNIKGQLIFTEDRVNSNQLSGKTLGYPLQAQLSSDTTATHLRVNGATDMPNLIKQFPFLENDIASGGFSYQADLHFPYVAQHPSTLDIASSLQGLTIEGDDYLQKSADASKAFKLNFRFQNQTKLPIYLSYGEHVKLGFLLDTEIDRLHSVHAVLGEGDATILPAAGMVLEIKQPQFKLAQAMGSFSNRDKRWPALRELKLDTQALLWQGQNIGMARVQSQFTNQAWEGSIDSALAKGQFVVPELNSGNQALILNMDMLDVSAISAVNVGNAEETITSLPVIQIDSKQVWWRGVNLGKLSLKSTRFNQGIHFQKIKFSDAGKDIEFTADWVKHHQGSSTMLNGEVRMENFGQFLADLGFTNDLKETRAVLSFTGGWSAAPQQFSLDKLNGQLQIHLHNGRIASIEPGVGRLLGLIALEQWAKRLSLDFSDVYRQGLSFDAISGDLKITNGIAYTDNLLIDAISAKIYVIGSANLLDKTLDQHVAVAPKSSDALPIAGTIMDNVAKIITNTVIGDYKEGYFFGSEYRLSGRWGDVQVTPVKEQDGLVNRTWNGLTDFGWLK